MKLSKQTSDAVEILVHCVRPDSELLKVGDIAAELGLSKQMALKLAYGLNQAGFVDAVRGPKGGIRLSPRARAATLGDIVRSLELQPLERPEGAAATPFEGFIDEAFEAFVSVLDQHTLADLARRRRHNPKKKSSRAAPAKPAVISRTAARLRARARRETGRA